MIKATEKRKIIAALGKRYTGPILEYLNKKKIFNSEGNPFISESILKIVNGKRENLNVEMAILKFAAAEKERKSKILKQRQAILK